MLHATGTWRAPATYAEAKAWLETRAGFHLVTRDVSGEGVFVVVGVHGRSAQALASSAADKDVEQAFVAAVTTVRARL